MRIASHPHPTTRPDQKANQDAVASDSYVIDLVVRFRRNRSSRKNHSSVQYGSLISPLCSSIFNILLIPHPHVSTASAPPSHPIPICVCFNVGPFETADVALHSTGPDFSILGLVIRTKEPPHFHSPSIPRRSRTEARLVWALPVSHQPRLPAQPTPPSIHDPQIHDPCVRPSSTDASLRGSVLTVLILSTTSSVGSLQSFSTTLSTQPQSGSE